MTKKGKAGVFLLLHLSFAAHTRIKAALLLFGMLNEELVYPPQSLLPVSPPTVPIKRRLTAGK